MVVVVLIKHGLTDIFVAQYRALNILEVECIWEGDDPHFCKL